jgi:hypothetical protein
MRNGTSAAWIQVADQFGVKQQSGSQPRRPAVGIRDVERSRITSYSRKKTCGNSTDG